MAFWRSQHFSPLVSALAGFRNDTRHVQIPASIQPGNSGGPVVDQSCNVVGVIVSNLDRHERGAAENIDFAINVNVLTAFLNSHGVSFSTDTSHPPLRSVELAEKVQSIAVLILCET